MSGVKRSEISLSEARSQALRACCEADRAVAEACALVASLEQALRTEGTDESPFRGLLVDLHSLVDDSRQGRRQAEERLRSDGLTVSDARQAAQTVRQQADRLAPVGEQVACAHRSLGARARIAALRGRTDSMHERLARWEVQEYEQLTQAVHDLAAEADNDIRAKRDTSSALGRLPAMEGSLAEMDAKVQRKEEQDRHRLYVASCIEKVCGGLGHKVRREAALDPNQPLVLEVDTGVYGLLRFELSLEPRIMSRSVDLPTNTCEKWIERFEDEMRNLGPQLEFHYEATGLPVRKVQTARPMPKAHGRRAEAGGSGA